MPEISKDKIQKQLDQIIWDKWSKGKKSELKPSVFGWNQDTMPWKAEFQLNAASDQPFVYRADGKYISFKPVGLWWDTPQEPSVIKHGASASLGNMVGGKVNYTNALGNGIDIELSTERTKWSKEVVIRSLQSLGTIPTDAEYLEIGFEIETDFDIEGWDKKSELKFTEAIRLSELSQLESVKTWDSHIIPDPKEGEEPEDSFERCDGFLREKSGRYYLIKRIPVGYLKQAVYPIVTDTIISYGSEYEFNTSYAEYISCAALDATHFVVAYRSGIEGYATIGVVSSGDEIAYGSEYEFNAAATIFISCAALDSTHFVVGYKDDGGDGYGIARIGVVSSGDQIAYGSEYTFNAAAVSNISCAALDPTHFVVGFRDWGDYLGKCMIGVVTGNAIAYGSEYTFNAADTGEISCAALDSTHFVVGFRDFGDASKGKCMIGVVSGTPQDDIAYGSEYEFNSVTTMSISCAALDSTHFVVGFRDYGGADYSIARIGVVSSGDVIAYGSEKTFNAAATSWISCAALDATHFTVGYRDDGGDSYGESRIGVVTGNAIAYGSKYAFNATTTSWISCAALDATHFAVGYRDTGGDYYGIARIGTMLVAPTVTTQAVSDIGATTATGNGNITDNGGENCSKRGVCWNTTGNPTVADSKSEETDSFGTGAFTRPMTGLSPNQHYYVKAYAYNSQGYGYGGQVEFTTEPPSPVADGDLIGIAIIKRS